MRETFIEKNFRRATLATISRFVIVNPETGVIDGLYFCRTRAESSAVKLCEAWPGLSWEVASTDEPYPPPGRVCTGHVRAKRILKRHQQQEMKI